MRGLRSTAALLVVLLGLGAYVYFVTWRQDDSPVTDKVFTALEADDIQEVTLTAESGDVTTLRKEGDTWQIVSPVTAPAAATEVSSITSALSQADIIRVVDEQPADLSVYGLASPRVDAAFKASGTTTEGQLLIGERSPTGAGLYAKRGDQDRVFLIAEYRDTSLNRSTFDLRDKAVMKVDRMAIETVEVTAGSRAFAFAKSADEWALTSPVKARADFGSVEALIGSVQSATMRAVAAEAASPADLARFGLDTPTATVALGMSSSRATLAIGAKAGDNTVYARDASTSVVVEVDSTIAEDLGKGADDYRRRDLFDMRAFNATRAEFTRNGQTSIFERVKSEDGNSAADTWRRVSPNPGAVERAAVDTLLSGLADIRAESFRATTTGTGLASPALDVLVKFDDGTREEHVTFGRNAGAAYASIPNEPGAAVIEAEKLDDALRGLDELSQ